MVQKGTKQLAEFTRLKFRVRSHVRGALLLAVWALGIVIAVCVYLSAPQSNRRVGARRHLDTDYQSEGTCNAVGIEEQFTSCSAATILVGGSGFDYCSAYQNISRCYSACVCSDHNTFSSWKDTLNATLPEGCGLTCGPHLIESCRQEDADACCANEDGTDTTQHRYDACIFFGDYKPFAFGIPMDAVKNGGVIVFILLSLYMFLALSIVCDEYFVPALERMTNAWSIPDEIAGATLMAAGGSAPELFTSFIGTFSESSVGFGTIVGSAVFNVLFVIGMCAMFSKGDLVLTSWPLARDSTYYCTSLVVLAIFFGVLSENVIKIYEAAILFLMYFGYVAVMAYNQQLRLFLWNRSERPKVKTVIVASARSASGTSHSKVVPEVAVTSQEEAQTVDKTAALRIRKLKEKLNVSMNTPFKFRAGILQMMVGQSAADLAGAYAVTQIKGSLRDTFEAIDDSKSDDGKIDVHELEMLLQKVSSGPVSKQVVQETLAKLDTDKNGTIDLEEFKVWYMGSSHLVKKQLRAHFMDLDLGGIGVISRDDSIVLLKRMHVQDFQAADEEAHLEAKWTAENMINCENFTDWFIQSKYLGEAMTSNEKKEDEGSRMLVITWPKKCHERILFVITFPLMITMYFTIPDVRNPRFKNYFVVAFFMAIFWIGIYSYLMVAWITLTGNAFGIPIQVMGLTFLAAGTSIPDLLSSVIVARKGLGDMAVSSSIGSNIFDVLVGLPFPWLCYGIYVYIDTSGEKDGVDVVAGSLFVSILILFVMILSVILIIHISGWKMTKMLGSSMFFLYVVFVVQDLARTDWD